MAQKIADIWRDSATTFELRAYEIDPHNINWVRREIDGVMPDTCALTYGYRSDTRVSAELSVKGNCNVWWIRLTLDVIPAHDTNYKKPRREELGTFCVSHRSYDRAGDITTFTLQSAIWAISEDRLGSRWTVGKGTSAKKAIQRACNVCHRQAVFLPSYRDRAYGKTVAFLPSEAAFSGFLFDACKVAGARMDVDGHGRLTFAKYIVPRSRSADWILDERDNRSIILTTDNVYEDSTGEAYNRSVVQHTKTGGKSEQYIFGSYTLPATHAASAAKRGFTRTNVHEESDLKPETTAQATNKARGYSGEDAARGIELTLEIMWAPIVAGNMIEFYNRAGQKSKWLVKTVEARCDSWVKQLTLELV